jgi:RNA polymerase sigma-70 factor (ECF subfamily)
MELDAAALRLRELTAGLARGDDAAWTRFHGEFGPGMFRHLLAATWGDYDLADEALQQAYLRIARHARVCGSAPMFSAWLRVVSHSALSDCRRRRRAFWSLLQRRGDEGHDDPASTADETRLFAALDKVLAAIDPDDRALLEAKYYANRDVRTIAEGLSLSPKAVESRLARARTNVRRRLIALLPRHE